MRDVLLQSATDAAHMLIRKEISSRELTELLLRRIGALNPALNAVVELRREAALQEAVAADEVTARGEPAGPLHGLPMTIKDSFNVAGMHTTWGNPAFKDYVAERLQHYLLGCRSSNTDRTSWAPSAFRLAFAVSTD